MMKAINKTWQPQAEQEFEIKEMKSNAPLLSYGMESNGICGKGLSGDDQLVWSASVLGNNSIKGLREDKSAPNAKPPIGISSCFPNVFLVLRLSELIDLCVPVPYNEAHFPIAYVVPP